MGGHPNDGFPLTMASRIARTAIASRRSASPWKATPTTQRRVDEGPSGAQGDRGLRSTAPINLVAVALAMPLTLALLSAPETLVTTFVAFTLAILAVEIVRLAGRRNEPWWLMHGPLLAWAGVVLVPWTVRWQEPYWAVGLEGHVHPTLPNSWFVHLIVLAGLVVGVCMTPHIRPRRCSPQVAAVNWSAAVLAACATFGVYIASYVVRGLPPGAIWRLGGEFLYSEAGGTAGLFELLPIVLLGLVLGLVAARRSVTQRVPTAEIVLVTATAVLLLGLGVRYRLVLLLGGWFLLQFWTPRSSRRRLRSKVMRTSLSAFAAAFAVVGLGLIARSREGALAGDYASLAAYTLRNLDVISSMELISARGASAGMLEGQSYREMPGLLIPSGLPGAGEGDLPAAQQVVNSYLDPAPGFSAPQWFEAYLNFGAVGAFFAACVMAIVLVAVNRRGRAGGAGLWPLVGLLGPAVVLIEYQLLSRLLILQTISTTVAIAAGLWLASRCLTRHMIKASPR